MELIPMLVAEFQQEAAATRRLIARLPAERLSFRPHEKSRTLGELAAHIARLPAIFIAPLDREEFDRATLGPAPTTAAEILRSFDENVAAAQTRLASMRPETLQTPWRYREDGHVIFSLPRIAVIRAMGINHLIHHRGQLSVYLRLLGIPLSALYGPTADEPARPPLD